MAITLRPDLRPPWQWLLVFFVSPFCLYVSGDAGAVCIQFSGADRPAQPIVSTAAATTAPLIPGPSLCGQGGQQVVPGAGTHPAVNPRGGLYRR